MQLIREITDNMIHNISSQLMQCFLLSSHFDDVILIFLVML